MKEKKQLTQIWITNLCLTQGIVLALADVRRAYSESDIRAKDGNPYIASVTNNGGTSYYRSENNEFFLSESDAKEYAENLRKEKISELEKELERLKNIVF